MKKMTSRERVVAALNHQEPDMVPIDFGGVHTSLHSTAHRNLKQYLGLQGGEEERYEDLFQCVVFPDKRLLEMFAVDVLPLHAKPPSFWTLHIDPETDTWVDQWGTRYIRPKGGFFYDIDTFIFKDFDVKALNEFPFPDPYDKGRVQGLREEALNLYNNTDKAIIVFAPSGGFYEQLFWLRGFEQALIDIAANKDFVVRFNERMLEWFKGYWDNVLTEVGDLVQIVQIGDDVGTQRGPAFNPRDYRELFKPFHKELVTFIKSKAPNARVYLHCCGSVDWAIRDFAEAGIDIINPVQVAAANMDSKYLKGKFGDIMSFWGGGCDSQRVLMQGTPADIDAEVKKRIEDFKPNGGFVFAPIHSIQANVPPQNIVAMYEAAKKYRAY